MKTRKINYLIAMILSVLFFSCSSDDNGSTLSTKPDIFIVGQADEKATLWKNGEIVDQKEQSRFESVFVSGDDVHIGGSNFRGGDNYAKIWKNGVEMNIEGGTNPSKIESIYVDNDQVYAAGYENKGSSYEEEAKLWKNGVANTIGGRHHRATSVFVHNNDVYVVTSFETDKLWKNNSELLSLSGAFFESVFVKDNDVYLVGYSRNDNRVRVATLWKNGVRQELSNNDTRAKKVFVYNNDVYVIGYERDNSRLKAKLWKNGVDQNITLGVKNSYATDVFVYNDDVYVVGYENDETTDKSVATIWINGAPQRLTTNTSNSSRAYSIYIR